MASTIPKNILISAAFNNTNINGNEITAHNAARDEILEIIATEIHIKSMMIAALGLYTDKTPNPVATPLPPLNLRKIENICPRTAVNPIMPSHTS